MSNDDQDREMRLANFEKQMRLCSKISNFIIEQTRITDRELLEMAAKAAGITLEWDGNPDDWMPMYYEGKTYHQWNPLDDNGDALRLAVKLRLDVTFGFDDEENVVSVNANWNGAPAEVIQEILGKDVAEATRRAIVRAAAQIGRLIK